MPEREHNDLVRAFTSIQKRDPSDPNSFSMIASHNGEPFRGAGWRNPQWWEATATTEMSSSQHDTTPTSTALRTVSSPSSPRQDGEVINPNLLYSYTLQGNIKDHLSPIPDANYSKATGYPTVRYPFSGFVGTDKG
ncbi:hypothetical protein NW762_012677 [Fusarium torreyae]|uniref:Uncharacterized protein n=1 Tax=Fusarium torreyae TaxID=1237075 RepID=A0A9W8RP24_9HYPO|nr:hypothetical protein NW762_012677 [Fusarium torreyae]